MVATASPSPATGAYVPAPDAYDEAFAARGTPRPHYAGVLASLAGTDLATLTAAIAGDLERHGVRFGGADGFTPFHVDAVPRILPADEWRSLSSALVQRARALNAFVSDVYGPREIVAAGVVPAGSRVHWTRKNESGTSLPASGVASTHTGTMNVLLRAIICVR